MKPPIDILPLFPELNHELVSFLKSLSQDDWQKQTVARKWVIKDAAAHLLDGNLRKISRHRDNWRPVPDRTIDSYQELVDYLNEINNSWVLAVKRLSPRIITDLLAATNDEVYAILRSLDPFGKAEHSVAWAGEHESYNWFNIAREYTELFVHQQQIRDAMNDQWLLDSHLYHPFLDIFMQALPYTYRDTKAEEGTTLKFTINGQGRGHWFLKRMNGTWKLITAQDGNEASETIIEGNIAWKLFSKSVRKEDVPGSFEIKGDLFLGEKVLEMVSVMA
jgi:Mycothiol maleylpyruvate isomerase N-terminal domain